MKKLLTILGLLICFFSGYSQQTYNPSKHVVVNDAVAPAQATPIDSRMMFYDSVNFIYRAFQNTAEVLSYLSGLPSKYRFGNSIIVVDSGGTLQGNGTYTNAHNTFYMFRDSTTNSALVKMWLFNDNPLLYTALVPIHITGTVISADTNILATKFWVGSQGFITNINGLVTPGTNITITGSGSSISPYVINSSGGGGSVTSVGLTMPTAFGVTGSPVTGAGTLAVTALGTTGQYIRGDGSLATFPALFNPIAGLGIVLSGTYPNITFAIDTSQKLDTVFAKYPLYVPPGTPDSVAIYIATAHQQGALDSLDWVTFNNKQNAIQWNDGTNPLRAPGYYTTYIAGTNVTLDTTGSPGTIKINASSSTALQAKQTYLNSANSVVAALGTALFIRGGAGISTIKTGTDTVTFAAIPDTLFLKYTGLSGIGYDSTIWTGGSADTFYSPRLHDSTGITHGFDVNDNLWFMANVANANNGDTLISGNIGLGGSFLRNTTIEAKGFTYLMDTLNSFQMRAVNLNTNITTKISAFTFSSLMETVGNTGGNDSIALVETIRSGTNYKAFLSAGAGTVPFYNLFQAQTSDSSALIQSPHIKFSSDTTLGGDGMFITELPYITDTTAERQVVWNNSTGKISVMAVGTGGGGGGSDVVQTYTSGATVTVTNGNNVLVVNPASPIASLTITLPTTWHTSNYVTIVFGGTITSGNPVITSLNIVNGSGQTLVQAVNPNGGSYVSGNVIQYKLVSTSDYRIL